MVCTRVVVHVFVCCCQLIAFMVTEMAYLMSQARFVPTPFSVSAQKYGRRFETSQSVPLQIYSIFVLLDPKCPSFGSQMSIFWIPNVRLLGPLKRRTPRWLWSNGINRGHRNTALMRSLSNRRCMYRIEDIEIHICQKELCEYHVSIKSYRD